MVNKSLFTSLKKWLPRADACNEEGALAYRLPPKQALAQVAATGFFNGTYYADAESQLDALTTLAAQVDDNVFLAKLAIYARERALMKDMPAAACLAGACEDQHSACRLVHASDVPGAPSLRPDAPAPIKLPRFGVTT